MQNTTWRIMNITDDFGSLRSDRTSALMNKTDQPGSGPQPFFPWRLRFTAIRIHCSHASPQWLQRQPASHCEELLISNLDGGKAQSVSLPNSGYGLDNHARAQDDFIAFEKAQVEAHLHIARDGTVLLVSKSAPTKT